MKLLSKSRPLNYICVNKNNRESKLDTEHPLCSVGAILNRYSIQIKEKQYNGTSSKPSQYIYLTGKETSTIFTQLLPDM